MNFRALLITAFLPHFYVTKLIFFFIKMHYNVINEIDLQIVVC